MIGVVGDGRVLSFSLCFCVKVMDFCVCVFFVLMFFVSSYVLYYAFVCVFFSYFIQQ